MDGDDRRKMDRYEKQKFLELNRMIFEANELLYVGSLPAAEEIYLRIIDMYKDVPAGAKTKTFKYALDLREKILKAKRSSFDSRQSESCLVLYDGTVVRGLNHLLYLFDEMPSIRWQCHINDVHNDLLEWIKYRLKDNELSVLLEDITDIGEIKKIVQRHLLLKECEREKHILTGKPQPDQIRVVMKTSSQQSTGQGQRYSQMSQKPTSARQTGFLRTQL